MKQLPKSLLGFYIKYAFRGHWTWLILYTIFFAGTMADLVLFPNFQRWFIALFEAPTGGGYGFYVKRAANDIIDRWIAGAGRYMYDDARNESGTLATQCIKSNR